MVNVGKYTSPMDPMGNSPWDPWITCSDTKPADLSGKFGIDSADACEFRGIFPQN